VPKVLSTAVSINLSEEKGRRMPKALGRNMVSFNIPWNCQALIFGSRMLAIPASCTRIRNPASLLTAGSLPSLRNASAISGKRCASAMTNLINSTTPGFAQWASTALP
jgi:hypothetical protein